MANLENPCLQHPTELFSPPTKRPHLRIFFSLCASVADALQVTLDDPSVIPNNLQEATLSVAGARLTQELDLLPESFWISTDLFDHGDVFVSCWRLVAAWQCMLPFVKTSKRYTNGGKWDGSKTGGTFLKAAPRVDSCA